MCGRCDLKMLHMFLPCLLKRQWESCQIRIHLHARQSHTTHTSKLWLNTTTAESVALSPFSLSSGYRRDRDTRDVLRKDGKSGRQFTLACAQALPTWVVVKVGNAFLSLFAG